VQFGGSVAVEAQVGGEVDAVGVDEERGLGQRQWQAVELARQRVGGVPVRVGGEAGEEVDRRGEGERRDRHHSVEGRPLTGLAGDQHVAVAGGGDQLSDCLGVGDVVQHQQPRVGPVGQQR